MIELINGDCLEELTKLEDNSVDLVLIDPPYNIGKDKWDKWKTVELYVDFLRSVFLELQRVLKDNESFYFFHNDFMQIVEIQNMINKDTDLIFKQFIVWNKRFKEASNKGFLDGFVEPKGLINYQKMAEYCLFYTFQDLYEDNKNKYLKVKYCQKYIKDLIYANGGNVTKANEYYCKENNKKGNYRSIFFGKSQATLYNKQQYSFLCKYIKYLNKDQELLNYIDFIKMVDNKGYESQRYTFNNQKTHHSVWDYEIAKKAGHITPKTTDLLENIIKHSSNENDTVLDCFMGSGSTGVACKNLNRNFIGMEVDENYFKIAKERINNEDNL